MLPLVFIKYTFHTYELKACFRYEGHASLKAVPPQLITSVSLLFLLPPAPKNAA
jgi:hypothetical protein